MKTFLFFGMPGHGHLNPLLPIMKELVDKKHKVICYSLDEFKSKITQTGAIYKKYPARFIKDPIISKYPAKAARYAIETSEYATPLLIEETKKIKPDVIIYDPLAVWGRAISASLGIPSVSFFTFIAFNTAIEKKYFSLYIQTFYESLLSRPTIVRTFLRYLAYAKKYGFPPNSINEFIFNKGDLNIMVTSAFLHPLSESLTGNFVFVGPSLSQRAEKQLPIRIPKDKKVIYISAGTIFTDDLHFYKTCIETLANTDYFVILSLGERLSKKDLPPLPKNIHVFPHVPQLSVLQKTNLFISHGGFNSINESLYFGVPMIILPHMVEQTVNAKRVHELGAGIYLKRERITKQKLQHGIDAIFADKGYLKQAKQIQQSLRSAGGSQKAVQAILHFSTSKKRNV